MILAIILMLAALAVLVRLIFGLAVYALPIAAGIAAAWLANRAGTGWLGAGVVGFVTATVALAAGQTLFALARSSHGRMLVGGIYALPAAAIGYGVAYGAIAIGVPNPVWHVVLSLIGAGVTGVAAFRSIGALAPPMGPGQAGADRHIAPARVTASAHPR